jgi:hypothetical protein
MEILEAALVTYAVEQDAVAFELRLEGDAGVSGEVHEGRFFVEGVVILDGFESESAVHRTGLKVEETEAAGEVGGEGAFSGASRPVNGDDRALALFGFRLCCGCGVLVRLRHPAYSPSSRLNLRAGGRLPKGFLLPLNLSKVLAGLPVPPEEDLQYGFFAPKPPLDLAAPLRLGLGA